MHDRWTRGRVERTIHRGALENTNYDISSHGNLLEYYASASLSLWALNSLLANFDVIYTWKVEPSPKFSEESKESDASFDVHWIESCAVQPINTGITLANQNRDELYFDQSQLRKTNQSEMQARSINLHRLHFRHFSSSSRTRWLVPSKQLVNLPVERLPVSSLLPKQQERVLQRLAV